MIEVCWQAVYKKAAYVLKARSLRSIIVLILLVLWGVGPVFSGDIDERRIQTSLSVFPRIIAVDNHFRDKLTAGQTVRLVFLYASQKDKAQKLAEALTQKIDNVAGMDFVSTSVALHQLLNTKNKAPVPTAIFVAEQLSEDEFKMLMKYAKDASRIVFSPYLGDVERGATAGIAITSRVKPYFNVHTLESSNIDINALLMQMSKRYE